MHKACSVHVSPPLYVRRAYKSSNLIRGGVSRHSFFSYSHQKSENDKKNQNPYVKYSHFHYIFFVSLLLSPFIYLYFCLVPFFFFFKLWRFSSRSLTVFFPFEITNTTKELRPPSVRRLFSSFKEKVLVKLFFLKMNFNSFIPYRANTQTRQTDHHLL